MLRSLVERYSLSGAAFQAPDAPPSPPAADPPAPPPAPAPPAPVAGDPPAPVEPPAPAPATTPAWALERISEATAARRTAEQEAAHWRELAERLQAAPPAPGTPPAPAPPAPRAAAPAPSYESDVARGVAAQKLMDDSVDVLTAGTTEFKADFDNTRRVVEAVGFLDNQVLQDLFAVDKTNAHKIMTELAKEPERAASIARMDSRRRTAELTRISMSLAPKAAAPPAPPASGAPPPRPALAPVAAPPENDGLGDDVPDEEWGQRWDQTHLKRA